MKKISLLIIVNCWMLFAMAQTGVSAGFTTIKGVGYPEWYKGLHLGFEFPKDDMVSYYGRIIASFPHNVEDTIYATAISTTTSPYIKQVGIQTGTSYFNFEGGNRYYIGNGYDYGWSAYGGTVISVSTMGVKIKPEKSYDQSLYELTDGNGNPFNDRGRVFAFGLGLNAGIKNHFSWGMLYFDMTGNYMLYAAASNATASAYQRFGFLNFSFNFGIRKDIY